MPPAVRSCAPTSFTAGDTVAWRISAPDTPPGGDWSLEVTLAGPENVSAIAVQDPDDLSVWLVTFAAGTTSALPAGAYTWISQASKGSGPTLERYSIGRGSIVVQADPLGLMGDDVLSRDERELGRVEAMIDAILADPLASFTVDGAAGQKHDLPALYRRQAVLQARIARARRGGAIGRTVGVRFGRG